MKEIKIQEIADELGMQSNELVKRVKLIYQDVKSSKSMVTQEVAQEIFDTIVLGKEKKQLYTSSTHTNKNINLYFSSEKIDITMLKQIASTYKQATQKDYIILSYNFSELSIVKILVAGLVNLDLQKYIELKSTNKELSTLLNSMNKILDDVEFEDADNKNPLNNFYQYIKDNKPEIIYIEGVKLNEFKKYATVFKHIKKLSNDGVLFEIGFVDINSKAESDEIIKMLSSEK